MLSPILALKGRSSDPGVTNVRNTTSPHWRRWLAPESRCVVPAVPGRSTAASTIWYGTLSLPFQISACDA
jgi:hypothetical protein